MGGAKRAEEEDEAERRSLPKVRPEKRKRAPKSAAAAKDREKWIHISDPKERLRVRTNLGNQRHSESVERLLMCTSVANTSTAGALKKAAAEAKAAANEEAQRRALDRRAAEAELRAEIEGQQERRQVEDAITALKPAIQLHHAISTTPPSAQDWEDYDPAINPPFTSSPIALDALPYRHHKRTFLSVEDESRVDDTVEGGDEGLDMVYASFVRNGRAREITNDQLGTSLKAPSVAYQITIVDDDEPPAAVAQGLGGARQKQQPPRRMIGRKLDPRLYEPSLMERRFVKLKVEDSLTNQQLAMEMEDDGPTGLGGLGKDPRLAFKNILDKFSAWVDCRVYMSADGTVRAMAEDAAVQSATGNLRDDQLIWWSKISEGVDCAGVAGGEFIGESKSFSGAHIGNKFDEPLLVKSEVCGHELLDLHPTYLKDNGSYIVRKLMCYECPIANGAVRHPLRTFWPADGRKSRRVPQAPTRGSKLQEEEGAEEGALEQEAVKLSPRRCEGCAQQRIQCSRHMPSCTLCKTRGIECTYRQGGKKERSVPSAEKKAALKALKEAVVRGAENEGEEVVSLECKNCSSLFDDNSPSYATKDGVYLRKKLVCPECKTWLCHWPSNGQVSRTMASETRIRTPIENRI
jgi:hypothetical protein